MPSKNPRTRSTIGRIAAARRWGTVSAEIDAAHRDLAEDRLAEHIRQVVANAPPLSPEQCDRLAVLLRGGE